MINIIYEILLIFTIMEKVIKNVDVVLLLNLPAFIMPS